MNESLKCLKCQLIQLEQGLNIEKFKYQTTIGSEGIIKELLISDLSDEVLITILKNRGYKIIKEY